MRAPCRTCSLRTTDHGGCRCQAYALTGNATRADPVCRHSPDHHLVRDLVDRAAEPHGDLVYAYRAFGEEET